MLTTKEIVRAIYEGDVDESLDLIVESVRSRRNIQAKLRAASLTVGSQVKLVRVRPKYLQGMTGTIEDRTGGKFTVRLDRAYVGEAGRYVDSQGLMHGVRPEIVEAV